MRIYISGGPNRQRFSNGLTQQQIGNNIMSEFPDVEVVKSGKTDYIVIDNVACGEPSATALATRGQVVTLNKFMSIMRRKKTSKKKSTQKKHYRGSLDNLTLEQQGDDDEKNITKKMQGLKMDASPVHASTVFMKYVTYVHMLISGTITPTNFLALMQKIDIASVLAHGAQNDKLQAAWKAYYEEINSLSVFFDTSKNRVCSNAMHAQRLLGLKTDRIATVLYHDSSIDEIVLPSMLDFFTNHNNDLVQLMMTKENETQSLVALDQLLTSAIEFSIMLK